MPFMVIGKATDVLKVLVPEYLISYTHWHNMKTPTSKMRSFLRLRRVDRCGGEGEACYACT